jgi:hypothetical protein
MNGTPTYENFFLQREEIAILRARELRLRERIDDLSDRVEEVKQERDLALHDLWKERINTAYWRSFSQRVFAQKEHWKELAQKRIVFGLRWKGEASPVRPAPLPEPAVSPKEVGEG